MGKLINFKCGAEAGKKTEIIETSDGKQETPQGIG